MSGPRFTPQEMIERLVSFDTTSRNSNLPLIEFVENYLAAHGVTATRVPSADGEKASLYATIGPRVAGGVVLSGHTDVVPVDGQAWDTDPFQLTRRDGKLFGRGTTDMKSFSAVALALVPEFLAHDLKRPLHLALSYDEEIGCLGAPPLIDHILAREPKPAAVIVGEPTNMSVVNAHKGIHAFRTTVTGHEVHSSLVHLGVNAIQVAAELIGVLGGLGAELRAQGDPSGRFTPGFSSLHVGTIKGGTALNIVPRNCVFDWECRSLPGTDVDRIVASFERHCVERVLPALTAISSDAAIETAHTHLIPAFRGKPGSVAEALALNVARQNATEAVSYGTEAGLFEDSGLPTIVCGPGDIAQAHQPNEFVTEKQIALCEAFMRRLMNALTA